MQALGPYRLDKMLGTSPVGRVWAGTDAAGKTVTLAVLEPMVAQDPRWREAFSAAANTVARSGQAAIVGADFAAAMPWTAWAGSGAAEVFRTLGQPYQPVVEASISVAAVPPAPPAAQTSAPPAAQTSAPPAAQTSAPPAAPAQPEPGQVTGAARVRPYQSEMPTAAGSPWDRSYSPATYATGSLPTSGAPPVTSGAPAVPSGAGYPSVVSGPPGSPPYSGAPLPTSGSPDLREPVPAAPPAAMSRRAGTWLGVLLLVLLLPGAGSGIIAATLRPAASPPPPSQAPMTTASPSPSRQAFVTAKPSRPGTEPPKEGTWPPTWPTFAAADKAAPTRLTGLGFEFRLPTTWQCTLTKRETGLTHYSCKDAGGPTGVSGELLARTCPRPCDSTRRTELRTAEEAWGLQWVQADAATVWVETSQVDGAARYGLVCVVFWHSTLEAALDRELVFRMTAAPTRADEVRKVASSIHQALT